MTRKYLTQDEVYRLMDAAQSMSFPERNRCLIMMAFIHGFRASELLDLRLSDIDASGKQLNIRRIKNGFSTTHPLLPDEYNLIKLWLKQRKLIENGVEGDWLFLSRKRRPISRQHFFFYHSWGWKTCRISCKSTSSYVTSCLWFCSGWQWCRYPTTSGLPGSSKYSAYCQIHSQ